MDLETKLFLIFGIPVVIGIIGILVFLFVGMPIRWLAFGYDMERTVWSKLDRAETSAEVETMLPLVDDAIKSLESKNQTTGYCTMFFKSENNSLTAQYQSLKNVQSRLKRTMDFEKNSPEYQQATDDIRGILRDMEYVDCWIIRSY